jgi:hypothetical protein
LWFKELIFSGLLTLLFYGDYAGLEVQVGGPGFSTCLEHLFGF